MAKIEKYIEPKPLSEAEQKAKQEAAAQETRRQERQAKMDALAEKQTQGKIALEDIYEQNKLILDILLGN